MEKKSGGWLDLPLYRLTKKRMPRARGINLVPMEKLFKKDFFFRPMGLAIQKEFGKRLSVREYMQKAEIVQFGSFGKPYRKKAFPFESMGLQGILMKLNRQLVKQAQAKKRRRRRR